MVTAAAAGAIVTGVPTAGVAPATATAAAAGWAFGQFWATTVGVAVPTADAGALKPLGLMIGPGAACYRAVIGDSVHPARE